MGVANQRSIAWGCVESFLKKEYDCIITYHVPSPSSSSNDGHDEQIQREKYKSKIETLAKPYMQPQLQDEEKRNDIDESPPRILACLPCCVQTGIPKLCRTDLPNLLWLPQHPTANNSNEGPRRTIDAVVHSIAYASEMDRPLLHASSTAYLQAQHISAYSLIEIARECLHNRLLSQPDAAITTLSYLGAIRTVPNYSTMSPAKAALECIVRTLAYEVGHPTRFPRNTYTHVRVNAVSAGPVKTTSARGISNFTTLQQQVVDHAPLGRNVTVEEVAETVTWLSSTTPQGGGAGITGQTIYVDAGFSSIVPLGK